MTRKSGVAAYYPVNATACYTSTLKVPHPHVKGQRQTHGRLDRVWIGTHCGDCRSDFAAHGVGVFGAMIGLAAVNCGLSGYGEFVVVPESPDASWSWNQPAGTSTLERSRCRRCLSAPRTSISRLTTRTHWVEKSSTSASVRPPYSRVQRRLSNSTTTTAKSPTRLFKTRPASARFPPA